jgi:EamA domain-containing membrane protein RarD
MTTSRWVGFVLVWISLLVMSIDGLRHARSRTSNLEVIEPD